MAERTCMYCLFKGGKFKWDNDDYCNKLDRIVDDDQPACRYFIDDSHDTCYDCEEGKDMVIGFYCKALKKTIKNPGCWVCPRFRY